MGYKHDIFISYKRNAETLEWIKMHFIPILEHCLNAELGRKIDIFIDEDIEVGETWPLALDTALACSKVVVVLWTKTYLNSVWCSSELSQMYLRELTVGMRTQENSKGLIFPMVVHDGDTIPPHISIIQRIDVRECFNVRMAKYSQKSELLVDKIKEISSSLANAIINAPEWSNEWNKMEFLRIFNELFISDSAVQNSLPKFSDNE